jgi:phage-related protein
VPAISVGSVEVDVVPNARGIQSRLRAALVPAGARAGEEAGQAAGRAFGPAMQGAIGTIGTRIGEQIGRQISARITASIRDGLRDGVTQGGRAARPAATRQGEETGGAFARSLRARLQAAFRSMPKLDVRLSDTGVDADLARLRARLETLAGKTVGIDVDAATARAEAADIEERLRRIGAAHPNVAVRADTASAIAQLQLLQQQIDDVSRDPARIRVETDGTFGQRLRAQVQAAEASLPNINLTADSSAAEVEIARLRAQLTAMRDVRIGVDMDTATATARIEAIQARLQALSASDADVAVRVDTATAATQLAAVQAMVNRLDGQTANVNVRVSGMQMLVTAALAFGPALLPVLPVAAAGLGAIAAAATAAAVGLGGIALVAAPAVMQIGKVLQAQKAAQDAATSATQRGGQAASQGAQKALQMASAQQSLATAHRNAARQIRQAEQGIADAVRNAAEANERAADQVRSARQALANAVQQAADRQEQALEQVRSAEESLVNAQRTAKQAQQDLNDAREDAARRLEDLESRLANASLSERDAVLAVQDAQAKLTRMREAGDAVAFADQQRIQLAYDQAVQRLADQRTETKRLTVEKKAADKAGVEGSDLVVHAQERLRQAEAGVASQQKALAKARKDAARQQVQAQRDIADAQMRVAEAQRNVTRTQEDGARSVARAQEQLAQAQQSAADSIASAQRQIASASLSAAGGVDQAALAQQKYQDELAKLTPSARDTMNAFLNLKDAFSVWSRALQPAVMPIFTRALNGLKNSLPGLTPFVLEAADAVKGLQDRAAAGFKTPGWQEFKKDLEGSIKPAIEGLGVGFGNLFKGMGGIMQAFMPHMDSISARMQRITKRFADWGTGLKGSPEFERFLSYSSEMAPLLAETFGDIGSAFMNVAQALKPLTGPFLRIIGAVAEFVAVVAEQAPWLIVTIYSIILAMRLWTLAMWAFNAAMAANPITLIVIAVIALVAIFVYAYNRFDWFREGVQTVWSAIQTGAMWLWNTALKPFFDWFGKIVSWLWNTIIKPYIGFLISYWKMVGSIALWLWDTILRPFFAGFGATVSWLWTKIVKPYIGLIISYWKMIGNAALWVWNTILKPTFGFIATAAKVLATIIVVVVVAPIVAGFKVLAWVGKWLWQNALKPAFEGIAALGRWLWSAVLRPAFQAIGAAAKWLWNNAIKPAWAGIQAGAKWMWEKVLRPIFRLIVDGLKTVGGWGKWLWQNAIKPAWDGIVSAGKWAWEKGIRPIFNRFKEIIRSLKGTFDTAVKNIKTAWDKVRDVAKKPVNFIVDTVYNKGIVGVWNAVAGAFGAPKLDKYKFASGGIMPGYTPGKDVHQFVSPTGGALELSGGEAIMRPEFTRAVGSGFVNTMNAVARSRGAQGIKAALAPMLGGNPNTPTDTSLRYSTGGTFPVQSFADGGIFGWIKKTASSAVGAGSEAWNAIKKTASWLKDGIENSARAGVKRVVDPLLKSFPGMDTGFGKMVRRIPNRIIDALFDYSKEADKRGGGGIGGPRIQAALKWAKTQHGKPYQWAGNGNPSWDCSGFMSAIESVIRGQKPHRRWATMAFRGNTAPPGWVRNGQSAFRIGITNKGVGHTSGTLGKTNVESRGGDGVVVGSRARSYKSSLYTDWYGFQPGKYDSGGYLQPGLNLAYNGTGRPEPVFTTAQANALTSLAAKSAQQQLGDLQVAVYVGDQQITDIARAEVRTAQGELIQVLNAS